jgi:hypothetical protein
VYFTYWKQGDKASTLTWYTGSTQSSTGSFDTTVALDPGTTYVVQAYAQSDEGEWTAGSEVTVTTSSETEAASQSELLVRTGSSATPLLGVRIAETFASIGGGLLP